MRKFEVFYPHPDVDMTGGHCRRIEIVAREVTMSDHGRVAFLDADEKIIAGFPPGTFFVELCGESAS